MWFHVGHALDDENDDDDDVAKPLRTKCSLSGGSLRSENIYQNA